MNQPQKWVVLDKVPGELQANILKGLLEAQEISVMLSQEGAGRAYGISVGPLGEVQILVPETQLEFARQILREVRSGDFENLDTSEEAEEGNPENSNHD